MATCSRIVPEPPTIATTEADDPLDAFLPPVRIWFQRCFAEVTPPQRLGWPVIRAGRHALIVAPTGSGKTLAAFLAALDHLWRHPAAGSGTRILYISPLKALNADVARNLEAPLDGILAVAEEQGTPLPRLTLGVRSGDTPPDARRRMRIKPPDLLVTTPESLNILLTSKAREGLRTVEYVIVDEIHALLNDKRGVFLALLLERLEALRAGPFVRIGLSATVRPLETAARFLGGHTTDPNDPTRLVPRPVAIVDAGQRRQLDLEVILPTERTAAKSRGDVPRAQGSRRGESLAERSIWPSLERRLLEWIDQHRSTLIFANNRRVVERLTARLNEQHQDQDASTKSREAGASWNSASLLVRAHHGSLSLEQRRATEEELKAGRLKAVAATASLELGIDMGAIDLVCQIESPGRVSRALQRVGRAGHVVGASSKGKLIAKTRGDLLEAAALVKLMKEGQVEPTRPPRNCLDVLAQQIVAIVAGGPIEVRAVYDLVRRADPYVALSEAAFESALNLVTGRFDVAALRDFRARVVWDRIHNRLHPLPGSARLAIVNGGAIPETGQYPVRLGGNGPRLGELDEEFVLERRVGETFSLGTSTWRIEAIEPHGVVVAPASGQAAFVPFWRGEGSGRSRELGAEVGRITRWLAGVRPGSPEEAHALEILRRDHGLESHAAWALLRYVRRQVQQAGVAPDDQTILIEAFLDPTGETGLAVLSPWGSAIHHALRLVLISLIRERLGIEAASLHGDDGVLIRLPGTDQPPLDLLTRLTAAEARQRLLDELAESPLFGMRFRQNAGRALLMPRPHPGRRSPLWLQRLRAKDLLQVARGFPDFPIVLETHRQCLEEDLDLPGLTQLLDDLQAGRVRLATHRSVSGRPSPFASGLIHQFQSTFLYEWDQPVGHRRGGGRRGRNSADRFERAAQTRSGDLDPITLELIDDLAARRVEDRLRDGGQPPRVIEETAQRLQRMGDLLPHELVGAMAAHLADLEAQGRAVRFPLRAGDAWIAAEDWPLYHAAFRAGRVGDGDGDDDARRAETARETILLRHLRTRSLVGLDDLVARYPLDAAEATDLLERFAREGRLVKLREVPSDDASPPTNPRFADPANLEAIRRVTLALKRREAVAVAPEVFADFIARRQFVHPATRLTMSFADPSSLRDDPEHDPLDRVLVMLQGVHADWPTWKTCLLPGRIAGFRADWLGDRLASWGWRWRARPQGDVRDGPGLNNALVALVDQEFLGMLNEADAHHAADDPANPAGADPVANEVWETLKGRGASFVDDLALLLGREPSRVRRALRDLAARGMVSNDRLEPLEEGDLPTPSLADSQSVWRGGARRGGWRIGAETRRRLRGRTEGRWFALTVETPRQGDPESRWDRWIEALLTRYGVLTRELAALCPQAPPWRELAARLDRLEWRGEVRRGHFVEGLSGPQFADPQAWNQLSAHRPDPDDTPFLIAAVDPANLYGTGAPFDLPLAAREGGAWASFARHRGHWLVLRGGRPVLLIEQEGKTLTAPPSASESECRAALELLAGLPTASHSRAHARLRVERFNGAPVRQSIAEGWLRALGFVPDPPGLTLFRVH